ncbi:MAG: ATP-binding protein [Bacteroidota bacterium]
MDLLRHIQTLISVGEHQRLDFKFEITDARKIAKTLVAFANTDGGRLLIGVKDNGAIAGMRSDEEYYMVESAANMYCRPEVQFKVREWSVNGKKVLEITISRSAEKPHFASTKEGKWLAYIRVADQNLIVNRVLLKVWKYEKTEKGVFVKFTETEKTLLEYLENHGSITLSGFTRMAKISRPKAETILIKFILLKTIRIIFTENGTFYSILNHQNMSN